MSFEEDKDIFKSLEKVFDIDGVGDISDKANISLTVGVVVDTDDPLQNGRLRIFCPSLNDNPKKLQHLPWAAYVSPFGGVINNACYTRGSDPSNATTKGAVHYGFWAIPEQGAHALVGCIDGDSRRRFWLGCFPSHQETHTLFNGRFKWNGFNGTPDGPFSSSNEPIQPIYENQTQAYVDRTSREWKTRGADYQPTAVDQNVGEVPNSTKSTYLDEQQEQLSLAEPDQWVKDILGAHGYDWTSFKGLGGFLSSKVYGLTTPGGHTIMMDDRAFNCRVKIRTATGHMLLMDDTNERIYMATNQGNNWMEMDTAGNVDYYAKGRFSVHAENDINFSTDGSYRVKAKKGIYMYAGNSPGTPLGDIPSDGQIRLHASDDMHIYSNAHIREYAASGMFFETPQDINISSNNFIIGASINVSIQAGQDVNLKGDSKIAAAVGSTSLGISATNISSTATGDVFFQGSSAEGSINSINATFLTKKDEAGSGLIASGGSAITPDSITTLVSSTEISIWTNRVPQHEPWPRVIMQDSNDPVNQTNNGYLNNVGWVEQFDNSTSPVGMEPIGKVEGDVTIERGMFWRR